MHNLFKKEKTITIINNILNIIMMVTSLILTIYFININKYDRIFTCLAIYLVIYLPRLLENTKYKLNYNYKLVYTVFVFLAHFLGSIINLYQYIWWFDLFAHFISGILTLVVGKFILEEIEKTKITSKLIHFIYLIGFVAFVAVIWEIIEYSGDVIFNMNLQHNLETGVVDTMEDMIIAMTGGLLSYCYLYMKPKKMINNKKINNQK